MEINMDGHDYRIATLDARKQFHIVRRMLPVISGIAAGGEALDKIAECVGKLSDEDADYVLFGLLSAVSKKQENGLGWAKVSNGNALMFADMPMPTMLKLAAEAFKANLSGFFPAIESALNT